MYRRFHRSHAPGPKLTSGLCLFISLVSGASVVPNSDPRQIITPLVLVGLGLGVGGGVRIRQSGSDFNEGGNNLAGSRKWAQHRLQTQLKLK